MDEFHPSESTIAQIAGGTFKGTEASRVRNVDHAMSCDLCRYKYNNAVAAKLAPQSESGGIGGWFRRKFGGG